MHIAAGIVGDGDIVQAERRYAAHPCGVADLATVFDPDHQLVTRIHDLGAAGLGDADPWLSVDGGAGGRGGIGDRLQATVAGGCLDADAVGRPVTGGVKAASVVLRSPFRY
ncbi:hypothetical protein D3C78_731250 [compost metagenome]